MKYFLAVMSFGNIICKSQVTLNSGRLAESGRLRRFAKSLKLFKLSKVQIFHLPPKTKAAM